MTEVGEYECSLTAEDEAVAKEELHEIASERLGAIETFKGWICTQPHIKCPTSIRLSNYFFANCENQYIFQPDTINIACKLSKRQQCRSPKHCASP